MEFIPDYNRAPVNSRRQTLDRIPEKDNEQVQISKSDTHGEWQEALIDRNVHQGAHGRAFVRSVFYIRQELAASEAPEELLADHLGLDLQECSMQALKEIADGIGAGIIEILEVRLNELATPMLPICASKGGKLTALRRRKLSAEVHAPGMDLVLTHVPSSPSRIAPERSSPLDSVPHSTVLRHAPQHVVYDLRFDEEPSHAVQQFISDLLSLSTEQFDECFHIDISGIKTKTSCITDQKNAELPGLMATTTVILIPLKVTRPTLLSPFGLPQGAPFSLPGEFGPTLWNWRHIDICPLLPEKPSRFLLTGRLTTPGNDEEHDDFGDDDEEPALEWFCQEVLRNRIFDARWLCRPKFQTDSMLVLLRKDEERSLPVIFEIRFGRGAGRKASEAQRIRDALGDSAAQAAGDMMYQSSSVHGAAGNIGQNIDSKQATEAADEWCALQLRLPNFPWGQDCKVGEASVCSMRDLIRAAYDYEVRIFIGLEKTTSTTGADLAARGRLAQETTDLLRVLVATKGPLVKMMDEPNPAVGSGEVDCPAGSGEILSVSFGEIAKQLRERDPLPRQVCQLLPGVASAQTDTPSEELIACLLELESNQTKVKNKKWYKSKPWSTRHCLTHGCFNTGHVLVGGLRQLWVAGGSFHNHRSMNALEDLVALSTCMLLEDLQLPTVVKDLPALKSASEYSPGALADWFDADENDVNCYLNARARKSSLQYTAMYWERCQRGSTTISTRGSTTSAARSSMKRGSTFEQWRRGSGGIGSGGGSVVAPDSGLENRGSRASVATGTGSGNEVPDFDEIDSLSPAQIWVKRQWSRKGSIDTEQVNRRESTQHMEVKQSEQQASRKSSTQRRSSVVRSRHSSMKRSSTRSSMSGGTAGGETQDATGWTEQDDDRSMEGLKLLGPRYQTLCFPMRAWAKQVYAEAVILSDAFAKRLPQALAGKGLGPPPDELRTNPMRWAWELQEPVIALAADRLNTNGAVFSEASQKNDQRGAARRTAAAMVPMIVASIRLAQECQVPPWQRFWILSHATCLCRTLAEVLATVANADRGSIMERGSIVTFDESDDEPQVGPQMQNVRFAAGHRLWLVNPTSEKYHEYGTELIVPAIVTDCKNTYLLDDGRELDVREAVAIQGLPCTNKGMDFEQTVAQPNPAASGGEREKPASIRRLVYHSARDILTEKVILKGKVVEATGLSSPNVDVSHQVYVDRDDAVRFNFTCGSASGQGYGKMRSEVKSIRILTQHTLQDLLNAHNDWIESNVKHTFSYSSEDGSYTFFGDGVDIARKELMKALQALRQSDGASPTVSGRGSPRGLPVNGAKMLPPRHRRNSFNSAPAAFSAAATTEIQAEEKEKKKEDFIFPGTFFYMSYHAEISIDPTFVEGAIPEDCHTEIFFTGQTTIVAPDFLTSRKTSVKKDPGRYESAHNAEAEADGESSPKSPRSPRSPLSPLSPSERNSVSASKYDSAPSACADKEDAPRIERTTPHLADISSASVVARRALRRQKTREFKNKVELTPKELTFARLQATGSPHDELKSVVMARIEFRFRASKSLDLLPPGTRIRLLHDASGRVGTIGHLRRTGEYELRLDGGGDMFYFDPDPALGNFEPAGVYRYEVAQVLVIHYDGGWADATVLQNKSGNLHMLQVACQEQKVLHMDLNEVNHTPAWLPILEFQRAAQRYGCTIRVSCGFVADPVSGRSLDILKIPFTVAYLDSPQGEGDALPHLMSIVDPPTKRMLGQLEGWGVIIYGGQGIGKTTLAKRLAMACAHSLCGYLPIMIHAQEMFRFLQEPDPLDALLWDRHGSTETYWLLRQALCCRRGLLIVDGAAAKSREWLPLLRLFRRLCDLGHRVAVFAHSSRFDQMQQKPEELKPKGWKLLATTVGGKKASLKGTDQPKPAGPAGPPTSAIMKGLHLPKPGPLTPLLELELRPLTLEAQKEGAAARLGDVEAENLKDNLADAGDVSQHPFGLTLLLGYVEAKRAKQRVQSSELTFFNPKSEADKHEWSLTEALQSATDMTLQRSLNYPLAVGVTRKPASMKDCGEMLELIAMELQRQGRKEMRLTDLEDLVSHEPDEPRLRPAWQDMYNASADGQLKLLQGIPGPKLSGQAEARPSVRFLNASLREYFAARCCVRYMQEGRQTGLPSFEQMIFSTSWAFFLRFLYELLQRNAVPITLDFTGFDLNAHCMSLLLDFFEQRCLRSPSIRLALRGPELSRLGRLPRLLAGVAGRLEWLAIRCCALGVEGTKVLAKAIAEQIISPSHVDLRHCSVGHEGMEVLADMLAKDEKILNLNLGGNIMGSGGAVHIAAALQKNEALQHLELENNGFAGPGAEALLASISNRSKLLHLGIAGNRIGDDGSRHLVDLMRGQWSLRELNIGANSINALGMQRLAEGITEYAKLEKLSLNGNEIGPDGMWHFSASLQSLQGASALRRLHLEYTMLGAEGAAYLASAFTAGAGLESLELRGNRLGSRGVSCLAAALGGAQDRRTSKLRRLGLRSNACMEDGSLALASVLKDEQGLLEDLDLSENRIGDAGAAAIADALREERGAAGQRLTKLALNANGVSPAGAQALGRALCERKEPAALQCLELSGNTIGDPGAFALCRALRASRCLAVLKVERNRIGIEGAAALAVVVTKVKSIVKLTLNGNFIGKLLQPFAEDLCEIRLGKKSPKMTEVNLLELEKINLEDVEMQWDDELKQDIRERMENLGVPRQPQDSFKRAVKLASLLDGIVAIKRPASAAEKRKPQPPPAPKPEEKKKPRPGMCYPGYRHLQAT